MTRINKLTQNPELFADDLLVIWDEDNQRTRSITAQTLEKFTDATGVNAQAFVNGYIRDGILYMVRANDEVVTIGDVDNININVQVDELVTYDPNTKEFIGTGVFAKDGEVTATTNTFNLGGAWAISSSGDLVALTNKSKGKSYTVKMGSFSKLGEPEELVNRELVQNFNPNTVFTDEITDLVFPNIPITPINQSQPENGHIAEFLDFRLGPNSVRTNIKIDTYIGDVLFDSTTFETATEVEPGIFRFHFKTPIVYAVGDVIRTETTSTDGNVTMMGDLSTMRAWVRFDATLFDIKQVGLKDKDVKEIQGSFSDDELTTKLILNDDSEINSIVDVDTGVQGVVAGNKILVDDSDPKNPIVSWNPSGDLLPGVNINKDGVQVLSAADTLNFSGAFDVVKAKDTGGTVNIELSTTARGTNEVGVFESTTDLLDAYPTPEDGLYARVLQGNNNYPDDRYESKGGNWIGMGGVAGQVIVDDNKSIGLIMGDGLKSEDDGGNSKISLDGNTPVLTFDVTTDSTRSVDTSYVGKIINIIQTPPAISVPMQITLSDHSEFKTGDTIKIAADRDGQNAYKNYYFAVYYKDAAGRQLVKYPANNMTMVRTDTAWDVQLDGRFTNVSIRPKSVFNAPYAPDEEYNTPVNAFVFADSNAVSFEVASNTNTRIVKVDLDSVTDNYIAKYSIAETDHVQIAYQGKYGDDRVYYPSNLRQDVNGWLQLEYTGNLQFKPKDKNTDAISDTTLRLGTARSDFYHPLYVDGKRVAERTPQNIYNSYSLNNLINSDGKTLPEWIAENPDYTQVQFLNTLFSCTVLGSANWIVSATTSGEDYNGTFPNGYQQIEIHRNGGGSRSFLRAYNKESTVHYFANYKANQELDWKQYAYQDDVSNQIDDKIESEKAKGEWIGGVFKDTINDDGNPGDDFTCNYPKHFLEYRKKTFQGDYALIVTQGDTPISSDITIHLHPESGMASAPFKVVTSDGKEVTKTIRMNEKWRFYLRKSALPYFERIDDGTSGYILEDQFNAKSGYDALISGGGSTKTVTYGDNGRILKISNATVKVELLQGMNSDDKPHGYFKYINSHNADVAFEWYDRNGTQITNNVPSICPKDTVVEVFADYAKDEYVLNFSQSKVISSVTEDKVQEIVSKSFDSLLEPGEGTPPILKHPIPNELGYVATYSSPSYDSDDRLIIPRTAYDRTVFEVFIEAYKKQFYCTIPVASVEPMLGRVITPADIELGIVVNDLTRVEPGQYGATKPENVPSTWAWNGKFIPLETESGDRNDPNNPSVWLDKDGNYVYSESEAGISTQRYGDLNMYNLMSKDGELWRYALRRGYIMRGGSFLFDGNSPYYVFVARFTDYQISLTKVHPVFVKSGGISIYPDAISAYVSQEKIREQLDQLTEGLAQGFIYAKNVTVG